MVLGTCGERAKVFTQIIITGSSHEVILKGSSSVNVRNLSLFPKGVTVVRILTLWLSSGTFS